MADLDDVSALDWGAPNLPDDFQPVDAILLVKGVYLTDDGDMTRSTWCHRWTVALSRNEAELVGALEIAARLCLTNATDSYDGEITDD